MLWEAVECLLHCDKLKKITLVVFIIIKDYVTKMQLVSHSKYVLEVEIH